MWFYNNGENIQQKSIAHACCATIDPFLCLWPLQTRRSWDTTCTGKSSFSTRYSSNNSKKRENNMNFDFRSSKTATRGVCPFLTIWFDRYVKDAFCWFILAAIVLAHTEGNINQDWKIETKGVLKNFVTVVILYAIILNVKDWIEHNKVHFICMCNKWFAKWVAFSTSPQKRSLMTLTGVSFYEKNISMCCWSLIKSRMNEKIPYNQAFWRCHLKRTQYSSLLKSFTCGALNVLSSIHTVGLIKCHALWMWIK